MGTKARKQREAKTRPTILVDGMIYYEDEFSRIKRLILHKDDVRTQKLARTLIIKAAKDQPNRHAPR